ncbi:MAG: hypothetical protein QF565_03940 [Arenicellales bacterium]|nr:hypothetical protein [Arenicellales bacterium]
MRTNDGDARQAKARRRQREHLVVRTICVSTHDRRVLCERLMTQCAAVDICSTVQARVLGPVHLAHTASAELLGDFVGA